MTKKQNDKIPLLVLGDFAWDVLIRTNTDLLPGGDTFGEVLLAPGGSAANVAVWGSRCGLKTSFIGKIGRDRFGQLAKENLDWEKVDSHFIETDMHRTASVAVWIDQSGQRSMVSGQGADFNLFPSELPIDMIKSTKHLHLTAWSFFTDPPRAAATRAAKIAKENGATLSFDPASFQLIKQRGKDKFIRIISDLGIQIIFPNLQEGQILSGEKEPQAIVKKLNEIFPDTVIALKLDSKGALILADGEITPVFPGAETIIDATGAGDSFAGAYLAHYFKKKNHIDAAKYAVKISAWVVNKIGARPHDDKQLTKLIKF
jgi:ribokinase